MQVVAAVVVVTHLQVEMILLLQMMTLVIMQVVSLRKVAVMKKQRRNINQKIIKIQKINKFLLILKISI